MDEGLHAPEPSRRRKLSSDAQAAPVPISRQPSDARAECSDDDSPEVVAAVATFRKLLGFLLILKNMMRALHQETTHVNHMLMRVQTMGESPPNALQAAQAIQCLLAIEQQRRSLAAGAAMGTAGAAAQQAQVAMLQAMQAQHVLAEESRLAAARRQSQQGRPPVARPPVARSAGPPCGTPSQVEQLAASVLEEHKGDPRQALLTLLTRSLNQQRP